MIGRVVGVLLIVTAATAVAVTRKECRQACGEVITVSCTDAPRPGKCRNAILKTCKQAGLEFCTIVDITTTFTTVTTTTTSSCPPPTALYCGVSGCAPLPALCPNGMTCQTVEEGCGCVGASIPCGDASLSGLSGDFCRWGTCPAGMVCGAVAKPDACGFDCACH